MHQVQIQVLDTQVVDGFRDTEEDSGGVVVVVPQLGGYPDIAAGEVGGGEAGGDAVADVCFVAVGGGAVDVAVAGEEGVLDGLGGIVVGGREIPGAEAEGWDVGDGGGGGGEVDGVLGGG